MEKETKIYQLRYLIIPAFLYKDKRLSGLQLKILCFILSYSSDKFYFSNSHLAKMFGVSETSITVSIKKLEKYKYVGLSYEIKAKGGKIRFIKLLSSELKNSLVRNLRTLNDKDNKIKVHKIKAIVTPLRYSSIKDITQEDIREIAEKYKTSIGFVSLQLDKLRNYCESKGRRYKNYKSALRNFVLGDIQRRIERGQENGNKVAIDASNI